jgi:hypothetical protein
MIFSLSRSIFEYLIEQIFKDQYQFSLQDQNLLSKHLQSKTFYLALHPP